MPLFGIPLFYWILEPEAKKAALSDPLLNSLRGNAVSGLSGIGDSPIQRPSAGVTPTNPGVLGGICNEEINVPDKLVGLSKFNYF